MLSKWVKVSYDKAVVSHRTTGMFPANHRLLSFGYDPSPLGFLVGMTDIINGGMTAVTTDGVLYHLAGVPASPSRAVLAPLIWLGHLISDVATPMGLPFPGIVLTQLLHVPIGRGGTIADLGHYMYLAGYDLRHYAAGGVVPALIEVLVRAYVWLRGVENISEVDLNFWQGASRPAQDGYREARLQAMLFWAHGLALLADAGKVGLVGATTGSIFDAALAVNFAHWQVFALRLLKYLATRSRDTTREQVLANRQSLDAQRDLLMTTNFHDFATAWLTPAP